MVKSKVVGMTLTDDEYKVMLAKMVEREQEIGKRLSVSQFLRDTLLPIINNNSPPSVPTTSKETKENVSKEPWDTDFLNDFLDQKKE